MARIGIDLGTTNSVVAMVYDDGAHVVPRGRGRVIPSAVFFRGRDGSDVVVGEEAERWMAEGRVVRSVKRLMGRTHAQALAEKSDEVLPAHRRQRAAGAARRERRGPGAGRRRRHADALAARGERLGAARSACPRRAQPGPRHRGGGHHRARLLPRRAPGGDARRRAPGRPRGVGRPAGRAVGGGAGVRAGGGLPAGRAGAGGGLGRRHARRDRADRARAPSGSRPRSTATWCWAATTSTWRWPRGRWSGRACPRASSTTSRTGGCSCTPRARPRSCSPRGTRRRSPAPSWPTPRRGGGCAPSGSPSAAPSWRA